MNLVQKSTKLDDYTLYTEEWISLNFKIQKWYSEHKNLLYWKFSFGEVLANWKYRIYSIVSTVLKSMIAFYVQVQVPYFDSGSVSIFKLLNWIQHLTQTQIRIRQYFSWLGRTITVLNNVLIALNAIWRSVESLF